MGSKVYPRLSFVCVGYASLGISATHKPHWQCSHLVQTGQQSARVKDLLDSTTVVFLSSEFKQILLNTHAAPVPSQQIHLGPIRMENGLKIWVQRGFVCSFKGGPTKVYQCGFLVCSEWFSSRTSLGKLQRSLLGHMSHMGINSNKNPDVEWGTTAFPQFPWWPNMCCAM